MNGSTLKWFIASASVLILGGGIWVGTVDRGVTGNEEALKEHKSGAHAVTQARTTAVERTTDAQQIILNNLKEDIGEIKQGIQQLNQKLDDERLWRSRRNRPPLPPVE